LLEVCSTGELACLEISRISSGVATVVAAVLLAAGGPAGAASPPPSWENGRLLDCDGELVEACFTPGGVFTSFHVVDSTDVIVPKHVEVVFPGETDPVVTLHVPGFDKNNRSRVTCTYTDPAGLHITLIGVR
jgi:hypothetical protein